MEGLKPFPKSPSTHVRSALRADIGRPAQVSVLGVCPPTMSEISGTKRCGCDEGYQPDPETKTRCMPCPIGTVKTHVGNGEPCGPRHAAIRLP